MEILFILFNDTSCDTISRGAPKCQVKCDDTSCDTISRGAPKCQVILIVF